MPILAKTCRKSPFGYLSGRQKKLPSDKRELWQTKKELIQWIEDKRQDFIKISDDIWHNPEIALKEFYSSRLQAEYLKKQGFKIQWDIGGLNTAFSAEWGEGKPVIGFAGEYDALSGLSQKNQADPEPVVPGGLGQGCGHNLLGVGCLAASPGC